MEDDESTGLKSGLPFWVERDHYSPFSLTRSGALVPHRELSIEWLKTGGISGNPADCVVC